MCAEGWGWVLVLFCFCPRCASTALQPCAGPEASWGHPAGAWPLGLWATCLLGARLRGGRPAGPQGDALCHRVGAEPSAGQGEAGAGWPYPLTKPLFPNCRTNLLPATL